LAGIIRAPPVAANISAPSSVEAYDSSLKPDFASTASVALAVVAPIEPDFVPPIENSAQRLPNLVLASGRPRRVSKVPRRYCKCVFSVYHIFICFFLVWNFHVLFLILVFYIE
jgi:hypothetical protein